MVNAGVIGTLIIYAVLIEILRGRLVSFRELMSAGSNVHVLRYALYGVAAINIFVVRILRRRLQRKPSSEDGRTLSLMLLRTSIITAAFCEIPAVLGFCLFLLIGSVQDYYQLAGVSFIMIFLHFPRYGSWQDRVKIKTQSLTSCE